MIEQLLRFFYWPLFGLSLLFGLLMVWSLVSFFFGASVPTIKFKKIRGLPQNRNEVALIQIIIILGRFIVIFFITTIIVFFLLLFIS